MIPSRARWARRAIFYLAALLAAWGLVMFVAQPLEVDGASMRPLLESGDEIVVLKTVRDYREGDVVLAAPAALSGRTIVKRIIAGPGRTLELRDGLRWLDGREAPERWLAEGFRDLTSVEARALGPDEFFLAGDNRYDSTDSRDPFIGPVKRGEILGRVVLCLWPPRRAGRLAAPAAAPPPVVRPGAGPA